MKLTHLLLREEASNPDSLDARDTLYHFNFISLLRRISAFQERIMDRMIDLEK